MAVATTSWLKKVCDKQYKDTMDGMAIYFLIVYMYMYAVIKSNDMRVSNDSRGVQNHKKH